MLRPSSHFVLRHQRHQRHPLSSKRERSVYGVANGKMSHPY
uniref:Uncharacterized protein n=1 Tax=Globisporangium ultimum (strain ATCC 200006 / CBS 805.95 / DAOM BR144) TaxID=431595 RepID=K3WYB5_GLOUD